MFYNWKSLLTLGNINFKQLDMFNDKFKLPVIVPNVTYFRGCGVLEVGNISKV